MSVRGDILLFLQGPLKLLAQTLLKHRSLVENAYFDTFLANIGRLSTLESTLEKQNDGKFIS